jgi:hypothetical protein
MDPSAAAGGFDVIVSYGAAGGNAAGGNAAGGNAVGAGRGEAVCSGLSGSFAAAVVFVGGGDVADGFVESDGVVVLPSGIEFGAQDTRVGDGVQVRVLGFPVTEE